MFTGRREITTSETEITRANIADVLQAALMVHVQNRAEIDYLWKYYKGDQPVLYRTKDVRPEILNCVVENHAYEIVTFTSAYELGEPLQYICRNGSDFHDCAGWLWENRWCRKRNRWLRHPVP